MKPPAFPWRDVAFVYGFGAVAVALNLWMAHDYARADKSGWLFFNCYGAAMSLEVMYRTTVNVARFLRARRGQG